MNRIEADMPPPIAASHLDAAAAYLDEVREAFQNQEWKYAMFLRIINDFTADRIESAVLLGGFKELLRGYNHLIPRLNAFLPNGLHIDLEEDVISQTQIMFNQGVAFCENVKARLSSEYEYWIFLEHVRNYTKGRITKQVLRSAVNCTLGEHRDLVDEFTQSLENEHFDDFLAGVLSKCPDSRGWAEPDDAKAM